MKSGLTVQTELPVWRFESDLKTTYKCGLKPIEKKVYFCVLFFVLFFAQIKLKTQNINSNSQIKKNCIALPLMAAKHSTMKNNVP